MKILFLPMELTVEAQEGEMLLEIAAKVGIFLDGNCGSSGKCGKCKVQVISGGMLTLDKEEIKCLTENEIKEGYRLACRLKVIDSLKVSVPAETSTVCRKSRLTSMPSDIAFTKHIEKISIKLGATTLYSSIDDERRILEQLQGKATSFQGEIIYRIPEILLDNAESEITVTIRNNKIVDIEKGNTQADIFGMALDIGTTTIVGMIWDLKKEKLVEIEAMTNPQSIFGGDVISRIEYSSRSEENLNTMQKKVLDCINEITEKLCTSNDINPKHIYEMILVGNTTMSHLFLGINPKQLARAPFAPVFCKGITQRAYQLGININPMAEVQVLDNIAGHVGSDITAGILSSRLMEKKGLILFMDVGTNGEIVLCKDGEGVTCSTAAGPAFEGTSIYQGMRASEGAIEKVLIEENQVSLTVINGGEPKGICGSGLIDAVAQMLTAGVIDSTGKLLAQEKAVEKGVHKAIAERLRKSNDIKEFVLYYQQSEQGLMADIVITQKDIREVQLAKGAICGGIKMLLAEMGAHHNDINLLIVAGAFGSYINKKSALIIGLFPDVGEEKIVSVGNAAGIGASLALLSLEERGKVRKDIAKLKHVELANCEGFQNAYLKAMGFKKK